MNAFRNTLRLTADITGYLTGVTALIANARRTAARVKMSHQLSQLTDRQLADMGIARKDIPFLAIETALKAVPLAKSLFGQLAAWREAQDRRVATHRQLKALDDRMLTDIGIDPGQLRVVSGTMVSTVGRIKEAARYVAQPVVAFTNAAKLAELDFQVGSAANQETEVQKAA